MANLTQYIGGQHYTESDGTIDHLDIRIITRTAYEAIASPDENTLYLITA